MSDTRPPILIPGNLKGSVPRNIVSKTDYIYDDPWDKTQREINEEFDQRITDIQELAEISIEGGDIQIATAADFIEPISPESRAKIPTVGAIADGYVLPETGSLDVPIFINSLHKPQVIDGLHTPGDIHSDSDIYAYGGVAAGGIADLSHSGSSNEGTTVVEFDSNVEYEEGHEYIPSHGKVKLPAYRDWDDIKPAGGVASEDLEQDVQISLNKADTAYQKPQDGIPKTDLESVVQTSLGKADTALQKNDFKNKGTTVKPVYFDSNGDAQVVTGLDVPNNVQAGGGVSAEGIVDLGISGGSGGGTISEIDIDGTPQPINNGIVNLPAYPTWSDVKPSSGIPSTDLSQDVQEALDKADTAVQSEDMPTVVEYSDLGSETTEDTTRIPTAFGVNVIKGHINVEGLTEFSTSVAYKRGDLCKVTDGIGVARGYRFEEGKVAGAWDANKVQRLTYVTLAQPLNVTEDDMNSILTIE